MLYESSESVGLEDSLSPEYRKWMATLGFSYKSSPLTLKSEDNRKTYTSVIDWFQTLNFGGAYRLNDAWSIGLTGSLVQSKISGDTSVNLADTNLRINYRRPISATSAWGVHALMTAPTGSGTKFTSDTGAGIGLAIAFEHNIGLLQYVAKIGYLENSKAKDDVDPNLDQSQRMIASISGLLPVTEKWAVTSDFEKTWTLPIKTVFNPNELKVGARYAANSSLNFFAGMGLDSINNSEPLDTRMYIGLKYSPEETKVVSTPEPPKEEAVNKNPECYDIDKVEETYSAMIRFDNNKDVLNDQSRSEFEKLIAYTKEHFYNISHVSIHGHASKPGTDSYNFKLSKKRAKTISEALLQLGLDPKLLETKGKGKKELIKLGDTEDDHSVNRRAEIKVWTRELKKECK
tara:strand:- start:3017 stop:4225 length:1209 start_codon:yes stop_codon:yes gene_type:complete